MRKGKNIHNSKRQDIWNISIYTSPRVPYSVLGELNNLHKQVMPGRKALLVISNGRSTRTNGYLDRVEEQLAKGGVESVLFDRVEANPLVGTVMAGGLAARENGCDMIVALGGGSVIDARKPLP